MLPRSLHSLRIVGSFSAWPTGLLTGHVKCTVEPGGRVCFELSRYVKTPYYNVREASNVLHFMETLKRILKNPKHNKKSLHFRHIHRALEKRFI